MEHEMTLAIDCGGRWDRGIGRGRARHDDGARAQVPTPYPLPPELLVETVDRPRETASGTTRVVGMPGMIRHGVDRDAAPSPVMGPACARHPRLVARWDHFDMGSAIRDALGLPTKVLNDAEVAGAGAITGRGLEMIITPGDRPGQRRSTEASWHPTSRCRRARCAGDSPTTTTSGSTSACAWATSTGPRRVRRVVDGLRPMYSGTACTWEAETRSGSRRRTTVSWATT